MKIIVLAASIAANLEQKFPVGFSPMLEQQQQSKSGVVTVEDGAPDAVIAAVAQSDPLRSTVGSLIVEVNRAADAECVTAGKLTRALENRAVMVVKAEGDPATVATDTIANISTHTGMTKSAELTFDGGALKNAPMSNTVANGTGLSTAINAAIATTKPSFSISTIVNAIEDAVLADGNALDAVVIVDQVNAKVLVYTGTPTNITGAFAGFANGYDAAAIFDVDATPASTAAGQFGE